MSAKSAAKRKGYPKEMYVAYARSVSLAMERRLMDLVPENDYVFWEWFIDEINYGRHRMKMISTQVRKGGSLEGSRAERSAVLVGERYVSHPLAPKKLSQEK
jgi:hypothetical protein